MKITFCGAAGEVTGSQHLLECGRLKILLDCGLFQGSRAEAYFRNQGFRFNPADLDAVILSHAHIDHCGNLPGLFRKGFRGPIYCTAPTAEIAEIMLADSLRIQAEDMRYLTRKQPQHAPKLPALFDEEHVRQTARLMEPVRYGKWHTPFAGLRFRLRDAGHILGSAISELEFAERGETRRVVFTGDLGRRGLPLLRDPELVNGCDILITESTYGNRVHAPPGDLKVELLRIFRRAADIAGKVIIPAFSLGRTQQVVFFLNELANAGELPDMPVFVDSPLSNRLTTVYRRYADLLNDTVRQTLQADADPFNFPALTYVTTQQESMALNHRRGPLAVIAASGMCEGGRVLHHLKHCASNPNNAVVLIGFQAANTLGRRIAERQPRLRIYDREYPLLAQVEVLHGLSGHADVHDFKWWFEHLAAHTGVGQGFLVHGEPAAAQGLAGLLGDYCDTPPIIPKRGESFQV